jgi:hypothetical protein
LGLAWAAVAFNDDGLLISESIQYDLHY